MDTWSVFVVIIILLVVLGSIYGVVRAAVISGMKEYYQEKEFYRLKEKDQGEFK